VSEKTRDVQSHIAGPLVASMILDFQREMRNIYPHDVMVSDLCAVGPLHSMIGLAIRNGKLALPDKASPTP